MVTYFNKKDLVDFGLYLLSKERKEFLASHSGFSPESLENRLQQVNHSDVENFLYLKNKPVVIELTAHTPEQLEAVKNKIKKQFTI